MKRGAFVAGLCLAAALAAVACGPGDVQPKVVGAAAPKATSRLGGASVKVVAAGDIACPDPASAPGCRAADTAALVRRLAPRMVLALGDEQYDDGSAAEYSSGYAATWGAFKGITFAVPGNHEYRTDGAAGYRSWWGASTVPGGDTWHSTQIGKWLVLGLDSDCTDVGGCGPESPQGTWLAEQLARAPRCVMAIWHHPRRSSGLHGDNVSVQPLWQALARAGADLVLNGHDHDYERFAPLDANARPARAGMREFVVGTGGKQPYPILRRAPGSEATVQGIPGVLQLDLRDAGWSWRFVTTGGKVLDSGRAACRP